MSPEPPRDGLFGRLVASAAMSVVATMVGFLVSFLTLPLTIRALGPTAFGLWTLATGVVGYMGLLDIGLSPTLVKKTAELAARGDDDAAGELSAVVSTIAALYAGLGLVGAGGLGLVALWAGTIFQIGPDAVPTFQLVLGIVGVQTALGFPMSIWNGLLAGLQAVPLLNALGVVTGLVRGIATVVILAHDGGLRALVVMNLALTAVGWGLSWVCVRRRLPGLLVRWRCVDRRQLAGIADFSVAMLIWSVAGYVLHQADRLLIGMTLSMTAVAVYELAARLVLTARNLLHAWLAVVMPAASALTARGDRAQLRELFLRTTRYLLASCAGVTLLFVGVGRPFLRLWVGPAFDDSYAVLVWLALGTLFQSQSLVGHVMLPAMGEVRVFRRFMIAYALVTLACSIIGLRFAGIVGVAAGVTTAIVIVEIGFLRAILAVLDVPLREFLVQCHARVALACGPAVVALAVGHRPVDWPGVIAVAGGVGVLAAAGAWVALLTPGERVQVRTLLAIGRPRLMEARG